MLSLLIVLVACSAHLSDAQVPRVCVQNATQTNATCCPSIPGNETLGPCGGPDRGSCASIILNVAGERKPLSGPPTISEDNRSQWPSQIFQYACSCRFSYSGYACQMPEMGNKVPFWIRFLPFWKKKETKVRKDAMSLTPAEKKRFVDVIEQSKKTQSDFVIINDTSRVDAAGKKIISYFNVSVYDYYVFLNYYATVGLEFGTQFEDEVIVEEQPAVDYANKNPNFIPFHRALLYRFEEELNEIAMSMENGKSFVPFAIPYWNWTDKASCDVCTDDLVGALNITDTEGKLSSKSPFSTWRVVCDESLDRPCDPDIEKAQLTRSYSTDPLYQTLPTAAEVDFAMNATKYDTAPYNESSDSSSLRNLLEGYIGQDNNQTARELGKRFMGMQVRNYINGTWSDLGLGPNDPLFWLHHAFLDKLYETWQTINKETPDPYLPSNATVKSGQGREDNLVGFYPVIPAFKPMKFSVSTFEYSYDATEDMVSVEAKSDGTGTLTELKRKADASYGTYFGFLVCGFAIVVAVVSFFIYRRKQTREYRNVDNISMDEMCDEKTRLLE